MDNCIWPFQRCMWYNSVLCTVLQRSGLETETWFPEGSGSGHRAEEQQLQIGPLDLLCYSCGIRVPQIRVSTITPSLHVILSSFEYFPVWFLTACCFLFRYVSRYHVKDSSRHVVLGTQQFKPNEFASQINLSMENAWGILRCVIDICRKLEEGKYLILKDPNKVKKMWY